VRDICKQLKQLRRLKLKWVYQVILRAAGLESILNRYIVAIDLKMSSPALSSTESMNYI
jgi:hypothetical protein